MFNLGLSEIVLIAIIALIFIGPKQLPEIARAIGRALNELKRASDDLTGSITNPKNYSEHHYREPQRRPLPADAEQTSIKPSDDKVEGPPEKKNEDSST